ncbi:hypothetical protein [Sphingobacterium wenxiniae]|uniref:Uncharacterized protein n=1 Tax=Sphingobacterium wenxiniae TaxID=683125 RepID=A0A1I6SG18_9SPHI|nr:hypothetical protein [Sphingobacterium wenxiniae]SFS75873.1 hypothetical protein SAMN05660206_104281 [Sphingobacterium wenxiniae]
MRQLFVRFSFILELKHIVTDNWDNQDIKKERVKNRVNIVNLLQDDTIEQAEVGQSPTLLAVCRVVEKNDSPNDSLFYWEKLKDL